MVVFSTYSGRMREPDRAVKKMEKNLEKKLPEIKQNSELNKELPPLNIQGPRIRREKRTIDKMVHVYCKGNHKTKGNQLCAGCSEFLAYTFLRLDKCPFQEEKSTSRGKPQKSPEGNPISTSQQHTLQGRLFPTFQDKTRRNQHCPQAPFKQNNPKTSHHNRTKNAMNNNTHSQCSLHFPSVMFLSLFFMG